MNRHATIFQIRTGREEARGEGRGEEGWGEGRTGEGAKGRFSLHSKAGVQTTASPRLSSQRLRVALSPQLRNSLDEPRHPHSARHAKRCKPKPTIATSQLVNQRRHYPRPAATNGMTKRNSTAVHIQSLRVKAEFPVTRDYLC